MTTLLPVARVADLDPGPSDRRWLIDELWADAIRTTYV